MYWPGKIEPSGLGTSARTRNVEVVLSTWLSMKIVLPTWGCGRSPSTVDVDRQPPWAAARWRWADSGRPGGSRGPSGRAAGSLTSSVAVPSPTRLPTLTFSSPIRPSIGAYIFAIAQVDLGVFDRGLRLGDLGLGIVDVDVVVGLGLLEAGLIGLDLGRALLALGVGLVVSPPATPPCRASRLRVAALLDLVEAHLGPIELELGLGDLGRPSRRWPSERRLGRLELRLGLLELELDTAARRSPAGAGPS